MIDRIFAVRKISTGKLVNDLTNPKKKFWEKRKNAQNAIDCFYPRERTGKYHKEDLEVVEYELREVKGEQKNEHFER